MADNLSYGTKARPKVFSLKPVDIVGSEVLSGFDATVLAINGFKRFYIAVCGVLEEQVDILMERFLVYHKHLGELLLLSVHCLQDLLQML